MSPVRLAYIPLYACMRVYAFDPQTLTGLANKAAQKAERRAKARAKAKGVAGAQKLIKKVSPSG